VRPRLEALEDRTVPAIYNVIGLADGLAAVTQTAPGVFSAPTLRSAIQAANANPGGNTINLTLAGTYQITLAGTPGESDNAAGEFAILPAGGDLTIVNTSGGTAIVDGNNLARVFDLNPSPGPTPNVTVTMVGFTIQNGLTQSGGGPGGSGGGIRDQYNVSLTLTNMVVSHNQASGDGGGVAMENTLSTPWTLTVNNSTISNNQAGDSGGGIETDGAGTVNINAGSVISNNTAQNQGGGIYLDAVGPGNIASVVMGSGGSGYTSAPSVSFETNVPDGSGATGVALISGGMVTGVFLTNGGTGYHLAPEVVFTGGGGTGADGAGVVNNTAQSATLNVTGALISGNIAHVGVTGAGGGGIAVGNGNGAVTITNSTIANNFSAGLGGGISDQSLVGPLSVLNSLIVGNVAFGDGGGIAAQGTLTMVSTEIKDNSAVNGGGLSAHTTTLTIQGSTLAGNIATGNGGGIELATVGSALITNTTITGNSGPNNTSVHNGGGVDVVAGSLALVNDTLNANFALNGGGIFWTGTTGSSVTVQNTIVAHNMASTGPDANNVTGAFTDNGGNLIGISNGSTGFNAATTQTGTAIHPLDPLLGPLQNNGGPTVGASGSSVTLETEALPFNSPAMDTGVLAGAPTTDERGFGRPDGGSQLPDSGAFEFQGGLPPPAVSVAFGPSGEVIEEVYRDGTLIQVDSTGSHLVGPDVRMAVIAFSPTGAAVLEVVSLNGQLTQYDPTGIHVVGPDVRSVSLTFNPGGQAFLEVVSLNGALTQYDPTGIHPVGVGVLQASLAFNPMNGQAVLQVVSFDGTLTQYDVMGIHSMGSNVLAATIAFSPAGASTLAVVSQNGGLTLFTGTGMIPLLTNVLYASVAAPASGTVVDAVFQNGVLAQFDPTGTHFLAQLF
jgi:predicted outer membrane repeat protein